MAILSFLVLCIPTSQKALKRGWTSILNVGQWILLLSWLPSSFLFILFGIVAHKMALPIVRVGLLSPTRPQKTPSRVCVGLWLLGDSQPSQVDSEHGYQQHGCLPFLQCQVADSGLFSRSDCIIIFWPDCIRLALCT